MRYGLFVPIFDVLADPGVVADLAAEAEQAGWEGVFVWDHTHWSEPIVEIADPWITLTAMAAATERIRLGPMVTPLARRRTVKLARETATLDRFSNGRLTFGVGLGTDFAGGEFTRTGEEVDARRRARMLDESLEVLEAAWSGEPVYVQGEFSSIDGIRFLPRPVQRPRIPIWVGATAGKTKPRLRAVRYDGLFPVNLESPDQLEEIAEQVGALRAEAGRADTPFDIVASLPPGADPGPFGDAGATWILVAFAPHPISLDEVRGVISDGPPI